MPVAIPIIAVAVGAVASAAVGGGIIGALVGAGTAFAITSVGGSVFPSRPPSSPAIPSRAVDNRGGSVCLNSSGAFPKWFSASVRLPSGLMGAR